jgi:hypothetical protein
MLPHQLGVKEQDFCPLHITIAFAMVKRPQSLLLGCLLLVIVLLLLILVGEILELLVKVLLVDEVLIAVR